MFNKLCLSAFVFVIGASPFLALAGSDAHGGDPCEDRIKTIRDDIMDWIHKGSPAALKLPTGITPQIYSKLMLAQLAQATFSCVSETIGVGEFEKTCRNQASTTDYPTITCNVYRFTKLTSDAEQYRLIHHEFAGLAGLEVGNGGDSDYSISDQVTGYLQSQIVTRLGIKSYPIILPSAHLEWATTQGNTLSLDYSLIDSNPVMTFIKTLNFKLSGPRLSSTTPIYLELISPSGSPHLPDGFAVNLVWKSDHFEGSTLHPLIWDYQTGYQPSKVETQPGFPVRRSLGLSSFPETSRIQLTVNGVPQTFHNTNDLYFKLDTRERRCAGSDQDRVDCN